MDTLSTVILYFIVALEVVLLIGFVVVCIRTYEASKQAAETVAASSFCCEYCDYTKRVVVQVGLNSNVKTITGTVIFSNDGTVHGIEGDDGKYYFAESLLERNVRHIEKVNAQSRKER